MVVLVANWLPTKSCLNPSLAAFYLKIHYRRLKVLVAQQEAIVKKLFEGVAWHACKSPKWSESYAKDVMKAFEKDIFPYVSVRHIGQS